MTTPRTMKYTLTRNLCEEKHSQLVVCKYKMTNSVSGYKEDYEERREDMNTNITKKKKEIYMHTLCTNNDDFPLCS